MEPLTIFAAAVAFIGIFHLLSTAINKLGKGRNVSLASEAKARSDWYCFFKMTDLLGKDWVSFEKREKPYSDTQEKDLYEQKRQQQARRPRLHA